MRSDKFHGSGSFKRGFANLARSEDLSEVGLPHSSDEAGESRGTKGVTSQCFPTGNTCSTGGYKDVEKELKEISCQSKTYAKLETLMNRVSKESLKIYGTGKRS